MQFSTFLKRILILDSASCLGMGLALVVGSGALAELLGLPQTLLAGAGYLLIPLGLFILWLGTRSAAHAALIWLVIVGNVVWTLEA